MISFIRSRTKVGDSVGETVGDSVGLSVGLGVDLPDFEPLHHPLRMMTSSEKSKADIGYESSPDENAKMQTYPSITHLKSLPRFSFLPPRGFPELSESSGALADKTDPIRMTDIASKENTPKTFIAQDK